MVKGVINSLDKMFTISVTWIHQRQLCHKQALCPNTSSKPSQKQIAQDTPMNRYTTPTLQPSTVTNRVHRILTLHSPLISPQLQSSRGSTPLLPTVDVSLATSRTHYNKSIILHNIIYDRQCHFYKRGPSPNPVFSSHLYPPIQNIMCAHPPTLLCTSSITLPLRLPSGFHLVICHTTLLWVKQGL
jgi:hypothetical protein